jgi:dethiobiotin synthetase
VVRGVFVTGTDTGVGKTLLSAGLAALFKEKGFDVGVMKPVESGCRRENGRLIPSDAIFLKEMAGSQDELEIINPYALEHGLAPALAAEMEGVEIRLEVIKRAYDLIASRHDMVIIEGAGGLLVPLRGDYFIADLTKEWELPLLIVTEARLGIINHSLLTIHYAQQRGIPLLGIVINHTSNRKGLAESLNVTSLKRWAKVPFLGSIPFLPILQKESIKEALKKNLNLEPVDALFKRYRK